MIERTKLIDGRLHRLVVEKPSLISRLLMQKPEERWEPMKPDFKRSASVRPDSSRHP